MKQTLFLSLFLYSVSSLLYTYIILVNSLISHGHSIFVFKNYDHFVNGIFGIQMKHILLLSQDWVKTRRTLHAYGTKLLRNI